MNKVISKNIFMKHKIKTQDLYQLRNPLNKINM